MAGATFLALGSNLAGLWGSPAETLARALRELQTAGFMIVAASGTCKSPSLSPGQADYFNLVVRCRSNLPPGRMLAAVKAIERRSGRRPRRKWSARTLDIDILMTGSRMHNWPRRQAGSLTLPHPEAHKRVFVLAPLCAIEPRWFHPALGKTATELLHALPAAARHTLRPA